MDPFEGDLGLPMFQLFGVYCRLCRPEEASVLAVASAIFLSWRWTGDFRLKG